MSKKTPFPVPFTQKALKSGPVERFSDRGRMGEVDSFLDRDLKMFGPGCQAEGTGVRDS